MAGRLVAGAENGQGPPTGSNFTNTPQTGGVAGHLKIFLDGQQFTTSKGAPSTVFISSNSGSFSVTRAGLTDTQHVLVVEYMGDGVDGYLPAGSTTITFTEKSIGASIGGANSSLASTKGSVVFSTAPKSSTEQHGVEQHDFEPDEAVEYEWAVGPGGGPIVLLHLGDDTEHATHARRSLEPREFRRRLADRRFLSGMSIRNQFRQVSRGSFNPEATPTVRIRRRRWLRVKRPVVTDQAGTSGQAARRSVERACNRLDW